LRLNYSTMYEGDTDPDYLKFGTEENSKFGVCYTSIFNNLKFVII